MTTNGPSGDLLPGDIIYEVNREPVSTLQELRALVERQRRVSRSFCRWNAQEGSATSRWSS